MPKVRIIDQTLLCHVFAKKTKPLFDFNRKMIKLPSRSEVSNRVFTDNDYEAREFLPCMLSALTAYDKTHLLQSVFSAGMSVSQKYD